MKSMKLIVAVVLVMAFGCRGMEEVKGIAVENQSGMPLTLKWAVVGQEEQEEGPRTLDYRKQLNLGSDVAYLKFSIGGAYHLWQADKVNAAKNRSGIVVIKPLDLADDTDLEMPSEVAPAAGVRLSEGGSGIALLNWFPQLKDKLIAKYGEQQLAVKTIAEMEQLIDTSKREGLILARDFFDLGEGYSSADVRIAADKLEQKIVELRAQMEAAMAARLQIMEAKAEALRVAPK